MVPMGMIRFGARLFVEPAVVKDADGRQTDAGMEYLRNQDNARGLVPVVMTGLDQFMLVPDGRNPVGLSKIVLEDVNGHDEYAGYLAASAEDSSVEYLQQALARTELA